MHVIKPNASPIFLLEEIRARDNQTAGERKKITRDFVRGQYIVCKLVLEGEWRNEYQMESSLPWQTT
jgi:hypothetical protein